MNEKSLLPSENEWKIMEILWDSETPLTSNEIAQAIKDENDMPLKMVRVFLNRLVSKNLVKFSIDEDDARIYHYLADRSKEECVADKCQNFVDVYFSGNVEEAIFTLRYIGNIEKNKRRCNDQNGISIYDLKISNKLQNILVRYEIYDLSKLSELCKLDICRFRNLGAATYRELESVCKKNKVHIYSSEDMNVPEAGIYFSEQQYKKIFDAGIREYKDVEKWSDEYIKTGFKGAYSLIRKLQEIKRYMEKSKDSV